MSKGDMTPDEALSNRDNLTGARNVCAIRRMILFTPWGKPYFSDDEPHEPMIVEDSPDDPIEISGYRFFQCRHCGCLYAEVS